jgi:Mg-chelatase subunit ChlD
MTRKPMTKKTMKKTKIGLATCLSLGLLATSSLPTIAQADPNAMPMPVPAGGRGGQYVDSHGFDTYGRSNQMAPIGAPVLQGGTGSTTLRTGTDSTTLQAGTESTTLQAGTDAALIQAGIEKKSKPLNILFIVDGSRSMIEKLDGATQRIDAAKMVLQRALNRIPTDVNLGLRVFGQGYENHKRSMFALTGASLFSECENTALWVPIERSNRRAILEKVRQIKPYGMTPLAESIRQAAQRDFRGLDGDNVIILITDGADTCGGDPCKEIAQLPLYGIKIKVDVVGLDLHQDPAARRQLDCIAKTSGGKYYDAKTSADLINSVSASVSKAIEGRVIMRPQSGNGKVINYESPIDMVPIEPMKQLD